MHERFESMTTKWFECAYKQYTGSIEDRDTGVNFRYRFEHAADNMLKAATYSNLCYECADDVEEHLLFPPISIKTVKAQMWQRNCWGLSVRTSNDSSVWNPIRIFLKNGL